MNLDDATRVRELEHQRDVFRKLWRDASVELQTARQRILILEKGALPKSFGEELLEFVRSKLRVGV